MLIGFMTFSLSVLACDTVSAPAVIGTSTALLAGSWPLFYCSKKMKLLVFIFAIVVFGYTIDEDRTKI